MNPDIQAELPQLNVSENQQGSRNLNTQYGLPSLEAPVAAAAEQGNAVQQGAPPSSAPAAPVSATPADPAGQQVATVTMPAVADDTDLIEKEWVSKAKQIVDQTKNDPYRQNAEMHKIKAEYIKKRYNKDIKLVDE